MYEPLLVELYSEKKKRTAFYFIMKNRQVNTNKCKELIVGTLYKVDRDIVLINYNQKKKKTRKLAQFIHQNKKGKTRTAHERKTKEKSLVLLFTKGR